MGGALVAIEGIDQAGKLTQARAIQEHVQGLGMSCAVRHYPDYVTPIGQLVRRALHDQLPLAERARTMLFAANRWEKDAEVRRLVADNVLVLVDRYSWSNVVYGLAQGYDEAWLRGLEAGLLEADVTMFLDIPPQESARRKSQARDGFERNLELLEAARRRYLKFAESLNWIVVDAVRPPSTLTRDILAALQARLADRLPNRLVPDTT
jgi:dTMP kinase